MKQPDTHNPDRLYPPPKDLPDVLQQYFRTAPDTPLYTFLDENGEETKSRTVAELHRDAMAVSAYLLEHGAHPGEIVFIALEHGYELAATFWGALYSGAVPSILAYNSAGASSPAFRDQIRNVVQFTGAPAMVCEPEFFSALSADRSLGTQLIPKPLPAQLPEGAYIETSAPRTGTAYIQFSSGTTGTPKGVVLSHSALIAFLRSTHAAFGFTPDDVSVGWLPLFHDMGLCTQVLQPVFSHFHSIFIAPSDWLRRPHILFDAISRHRGTISWMPNFAFNFCQRHVHQEHLKGLDLSSWRILGSGSEPVQMEALDGFAAQFASYGFDRQALSVAYGLAEHVAGVTGTPKGTAPSVDWVSEVGLQNLLAEPLPPGSEGARQITSCGIPKPSVAIKVVDEFGDPLAERKVGEVLVAGPCLFDGYYNLPEETSVALQDGWLHTGDLGYFHDGELYICGRKKELIIVRGRNILPHHIEEIALKVLGKNIRYSVAFGIDDLAIGTEVPVLVCELRQDQDEQTLNSWRAALREQVSSALQVYLEHIRFVEKGWILKTTSGKINHIANRAKYQREFPDLHAQTAVQLEDRTIGWSPVEIQLHQMWAGLLNRADIGLHDSFFRVGGDSLTAAQLLLEIESRFGFDLPSSMFFEEATISTMARTIERRTADLPERIAVPIQPVVSRDGRPIFFCVHAIRGDVLGYWSLSQALGSSQPLYGLQARGLFRDSPADDRVEKMAARYIAAMKEIQPHGPYYIGGFCFGGVVAFEMAQQLTHTGEQLAGLVVIDRHAPRASTWQSVLVDELRRDYAFFIHLPRELQRIFAMDRAQRRARLARVTRRLFKRIRWFFGGENQLALEDITDPSEYSRTRQKVDTAIIEAYQLYRPKPYQGDLTLIRSPRGVLDPDKAMGWDRLVSGKVTVQIIPGSHEQIMNPPYVQVLAQKLRELLNP